MFRTRSLAMVIECKYGDGARCTLRFHRATVRPRIATHTSKYFGMDESIERAEEGVERMCGSYTRDESTGNQLKCIRTVLRSLLHHFVRDSTYFRWWKYICERFGSAFENRYHNQPKTSVVARYTTHERVQLLNFTTFSVTFGATLRPLWDTKR